MKAYFSPEEWYPVMEETLADTDGLEYDVTPDVLERYRVAYAQFVIARMALEDDLRRVTPL